MRVKKKFHGSGSRSSKELFISKAIDGACKKMKDVWPWTSMEFSIGKEMADRIYVPLNDLSIDIKDNKAAIVYVMQRMYLYYIHKSGFSIDNKKIAPLIEKIVANRRMVKDGFADDLSYYYYSTLAVKNKYVKSMDGFLDVSSSWLSFYGEDGYNTGMFRDLVRQMFKIESNIGKDGSEFLAYLKIGLKDNVYNHADEISKKYYDITKT